jgi:hypothetical protein
MDFLAMNGDQKIPVDPVKINNILIRLEHLNNYRRALIDSIVRFLVRNRDVDIPVNPRRLRQSLNRLFPCWYLNAVNNNNVVDLIPVKPIVNPKDVSYKGSLLGVTESYHSSSEYRLLQNLHQNLQKNLPLVSSSQYTSPPGIHSDIQQSVIYVSFSDHVVQLRYPHNFGYHQTFIHNYQWKRLCQLWNKHAPPNLFIENVFELVNIYRFLELKNNSLSVPPHLLTDNSPLKVIELFGSPLNTCTDYCSPLAIEKQFNSLGSFFDYKLQSGKRYIVNPPFDDLLMTRMAYRILDFINTENHQIPTEFIVIIPVWDSHSQKQLNMTNCQMTFRCLDLLLPYVHQRDILTTDFVFYDYSHDKYVSIIPCHILFIVTGPYSYKHHFKSFIEQWKTLSTKYRQD